MPKTWLEQGAGRVRIMQEAAEASESERNTRRAVLAAWNKGISDRKDRKPLISNPYIKTNLPGNDYGFWADGWLWWERTERVNEAAEAQRAADIAVVEALALTARQTRSKFTPGTSDYWANEGRYRAFQAAVEALKASRKSLSPSMGGL